MAADIRTVFNVPNQEKTEAKSYKIVEGYTQCTSGLADWLEGNILEVLTVFAFPADHQYRTRTVNHLELVCLEIQRRTRVAGIFPGEASFLRLINALLIGISETWKTGKI